MVQMQERTEAMENVETARGIVVGHTHWDREWYLPFEGFRARLVAMMDGLVDILEADPAFKCFVLDGQTIMIDVYLEVRPEAADRVRRMVHDGRLVIGPWYTAVDTFLPDPEHPVQWDVHGPWEYSQRYPGPQCWRINDIEPALHSELGAPGIASLQTQRRYLSPKHRSRNPANPAWRHHGGAWWDHSATIEQLFGPIEDDEMAVLASQWLQAEALRYYVVETRRRWPRSGGIFPWQLNEPWPNMACTSAVEHGGRPKLAYHAVREAYRPMAATARYHGLTITPGELLRAEIWALNDGDSAEADLLVTLRDPDGRELASDISRSVTLAADASLKVLDLEMPLPEGYSGLVLLELTLAGTSSRYLFSSAPQPWLSRVLDRPAILAGMFD